MLLLFTTMAQEPLPYASVPEAEENYSAGAIVSRTIDGLGFRYYWATEGLTQQDLVFSAADDTRNILQTLEHILELSKAVRNAVEQRPNVRPQVSANYTLEQLRIETLTNLKIASQAYKNASDKAFNNFDVVFKRGEKTIPFPFWNLVNGQLSDAIYHNGQIVLLRRIAGNPINPKVNVFLGKLNE
ncbi:hypothetical protein [Flavobacterium sp. ASW18X]|uniref:hypothetical protein n=1 Tax=Flavobacterium sp. ASW18X TaxID=2572595 RepID=UPI0010AE7033|nr:hypothetical protein [Flavobacterium sp. ASW18X]TKD65270.1 hypothetical protein FBT53_07005 [Flavobacterium sp. ASW18X]